MGEIMDLVVRIFDSNEWGYELYPEESALRSAAEVYNGSFGYFVFTDEESGRLAIFVSVSPWTPAEARDAVYAYLMRTNWHLLGGSFQMDLSDGEVQYRVFLNVQASTFSEEMFVTALMGALEAVDQAYAGLMAVTWNDLSPAEATGEAEYGDEAPVAMVQ